MHEEQSGKDTKKKRHIKQCQRCFRFAKKTPPPKKTKNLPPQPPKTKPSDRTLFLATVGVVSYLRQRSHYSRWGTAHVLL